MIPLQRSESPPELDDRTVRSLTDEYHRSGKSVWNVNFIKSALLTSSSYKCAYCETNIIEESKYMEVEHFRCKIAFPSKVVEWENLLPSCKRCNGRKSSHNVDVDGMIINPYDVDPSLHLYFQNYRLRWKDEIGRRTIETLYLNDSARMVGVRMEIGENIAKSLELIRELAETYANDTTNSRLRNRVVRGVEALLDECRPAAQFSALAATVLISDPNYIWLKDFLLRMQIWGDLATLDVLATSVAMSPA